MQWSSQIVNRQILYLIQNNNIFKTLQSPEEVKANADAAYNYGRSIGIAFQLVDDLLDFEASSEQLGKPAAADLKLGLATAPVLFATTKFPELEDMIARRFTKPGDVEKAFEFVSTCHLKILVTYKFTYVLLS